MPKKSDNANLPAKLDLRRHFLRKYHADGAARVMDCCAGSGRIWFQLRREFVIASYWAIDTKPKPGRLKVDSSRILAQPGLAENVIDINDGRPWEKWGALLPNVAQPTTVFLTLGHGGHGRIRIRGDDLLAIGLSASMAEKLSGAITYQLLQPVIRHHLGRAISAGLRVIEAIEADCGKNIRCFGLRLERKAA